MPISTQMKKDEAAFRKIVKQSRLAREEAASRKIKQKQQQRRKAAAAAEGADTGVSPTPVAETNASDSAKTQKRKGAIILPDEVADLRRRLFSGEASSSESPVAQKSKSPKGKQSASGNKRSAQKAASVSCSSSPRPEPPFSMEVHHKNKQILVDVTLHHVPGAHVDVSETTDTKLVVDTSRHTKKYRLELPMPAGMRIDAANATCEMDCDSGVLRCVLPIKGDIPQELVAEREKMIEAIRKQKALRFRMSEDGELKVRSRRALLVKNTPEESAPRGTKREREEEEEEEEAQAEEATVPKAESHEETNVRAGKKSPTKKKAKKEPTTNGTERRARPPQPPEQKAKTAKKSSGNAFDAEHRRAVSLAKAAGKAAQSSLRESIARAKEVQQKRMERLQKRTDRREVRDERTQNSFARVLEEQRRQLLAQAELTASVSSAEKRAQAKRKSSGKSVSFAAGN